MLEDILGVNLQYLYKVIVNFIKKVLSTSGGILRMVSRAET
jgi:hypothetical protein